MRIRRAVIVSLVAFLAVLALAGPASAGGRPDPPPGWLGEGIVITLLVIGAIFLAIVALGIAERRDRR
jgi:hypothetical protein